jgi:ABC-type polysaccharide/polyol phosphate export permease
LNQTSARAWTALAARFVLRDLRNRYLGSISGLAWALVQPLLLLAIYAVVFIEVLKVRWPDSAGPGFVPYMALGIWPWTAFAEGLNRGTVAIQEHAQLLSKVALPRRLLVVAPVAGSFLIHGAGFLAVLIVLAATGESISLAGLPLAFGAYLLLFGFTLGMAWLTSALNVFVRDLAVVLAQLLTLWFFLTPIFFRRDMVPERFLGAVAFNPMAAFVDSFRASLLPDAAAPLASWLVPLAAGLALGVGALVFARLERHFEDYL